MADEENQVVSKKPVQNKGFWGSLGLFQKLVLMVLFIAFFIVGVTFVLGGINNFYELIFIFLFISLLGLVAYLVVWAGQIIFAQKYYSPKEDYFTRLNNLALDHCPRNLNNIYFQGDKDKQGVYAGKIIGCLGIPYLIGEIEKDKDGNDQWIESKITGKKYPKLKKISYGADGDTYFIYKSGWFIFKKTHYFRCNRELHGDLNGDVHIYDINPVPYGKFFTFPFKQIQKDVGRVMLQSQMETLIATHEHQGDLISQAADSALYYNPYIRMVEKTNTEVQREG